MAGYSSLRSPILSREVFFTPSPLGAVVKSWFWDGPIDYHLQAMFSLQEEEEWGRLERWGGFVRLLWC